MNEKKIILEVVGKKEDFTYLHGSEKAAIKFKEWLLPRREDNLSKEADHVLVHEGSFMNYIAAATLCGLRPSREETFAPAI